MRLKQLDLLGYKSFAEHTQFRFDGGITAIVGPNGSGKSNIADAIRWVLGEKAFSLLRARKTEDLIFFGSERRARMGMAEATITLDNSDGWLPVDFAEVAITRRSFRSGQTVYLLNGTQVRLRDIIDLLGKSGLSRRTYTVVGQGLIDAALSLRPQERRALIEEAAGLTLYQSRRADTLNKLAETQQNVLRVHDLIAEITPRLRQLARQAQRAKEYDEIHQQLDDALRIWYSHRWKQGNDELRRARTAAQYHLGQLNAQRAHLQELGKSISALRSRQGELRKQLAAWHRESSALHAQSEAHQRDLAVAEERRRMLLQRHEEILAEVTPLESRRASQEEQISAAEAKLSSLLAAFAQQQTDVDAAQARFDAHQTEVAAQRAARDQAQQSLVDLRTETAEHTGRLDHLAERRAEIEESRQANQVACHDLGEKLLTLRGELAATQAKLRTTEDVLRQLEEQRSEHEGQLSELQEQRNRLTERKNDLDQRLGRLSERHDVLTRTREEGAGLYEGVRNIRSAAGTAQAAGESPELSGILGTVAELIRVPREWETAIEVALGGQLQDIVVESWQDAQAAIAYLKRTRGGRATFLPLDTLRPGDSLQVPQIPGVVGVAASLVECPARLRPIASYLLGRTIVCKNLSAARRVLSSLRGGYQIVTPEGELVRSSGALTGGARKQRKRGGILSREREWRELPERLRTLQEQRRTLAKAIQTVIAQENSLRDRAKALLIEKEERSAQQAAHEREQTQLQRQMEQVEQETAWHLSLIDRAEQDVEELAKRETILRQSLADLQAQASAAQAELAALETQIEQLDDGELVEQLTERRAELALTRQRQASQEGELRGYRQSLKQNSEQIESRRRRAAELSQRLTDTESRIAEVRQRASTLAGEIQQVSERVDPAEGQLGELSNEQNRIEKEERRVQVRLQALESRHSHAQLDVARKEDALTNLRRQIEDDLGLVDLDLGDDLSGQPLLPLKPLVSSLPEVDVLPEGLEEQVHALRRRLQRVGPVNPNAVQEHQEVQQRHEFLSTQAQDLEQATEQLKTVIAELDEVMKREFRRTFNAIAREFKVCFRELFRGGSALLKLTDPDDLLNAGIDIVARPPGKRQQGLALLSGGERALTATALIFAILTVSPTPFCVLDEVDAALDEANVGRFRNMLKALSEKTQFVIITHNRYTIEVADIVYGISMRPDSTSCVISHRMDQEDE